MRETAAGTPSVRDSTFWEVNDSVLKWPGLGPAVKLAWQYLYRVNHGRLGALCRPVSGDEIAKHHGVGEAKKCGRDYISALLKAKLIETDNGAKTGAVTWLHALADAKRMRELDVVAHTGQAELDFPRGAEKDTLAEEREEEPATVHIASLPGPSPALTRRAYESASEELCAESGPDSPPPVTAELTPEKTPEKTPEVSPTRTNNPSRENSLTPITYHPSKTAMGVEDSKAPGVVSGKNSGGKSLSSSPRTRQSPQHAASVLEHATSVLLNEEANQRRWAKGIAELTERISSSVADPKLKHTAVTKITTAVMENPGLRRELLDYLDWLKKKRLSGTLEADPGAVFMSGMKKKFAKHRVPWITDDEATKR